MLEDEYKRMTKICNDRTRPGGRLHQEDTRTLGLDNSTNWPSSGKERIRRPRERGIRQIKRRTRKSTSQLKEELDRQKDQVPKISRMSKSKRQRQTDAELLRYVSVDNLHFC